MNHDIASPVHQAIKPILNQPNSESLLTKFDDYPLSHPLQTWIENNPGATRLQVAESSYDLSRYQVYNWLAASVERGDIICTEGMYYSPLQEQ